MAMIVIVNYMVMVSLLGSNYIGIVWIALTRPVDVHCFIRLTYMGDIVFESPVEVPSNAPSFYLRYFRLSWVICIVLGYFTYEFGTWLIICCFKFYGLFLVVIESYPIRKALYLT